MSNAVSELASSLIPIEVLFVVLEQEFIAKITYMYGLADFNVIDCVRPAIAVAVLLAKTILMHEY